MREIKFRVWDDTSKVMRVVDCLVCLKNGTHRIMSGEEILNTEGDKYGKDILMQFTGLKDKNGKEIYEGDIYTHGDLNIKYTVKYKGCEFIGKQNGSSSYAGLIYWLDRIEVIGNIYENTKLLNP